MALTYTKLFTQAQVATTAIASAVAIYTVPAAPTTTLLRNGRIRLTNTSSAAVAATMYAGGTTAAFQFVPGVSIAPNAALEVDLPQMAAGDALYGVAGTSAAISVASMDGVLQS